MEKEVKELVKVTAPSKGTNQNMFTDAQLGVLNSGYIDHYDEALELLEKKDITVQRSRDKGKDR